jgi:hypothetical protein
MMMTMIEDDDDDAAPGHNITSMLTDPLVISATNALLPFTCACIPSLLGSAAARLRQAATPSRNVAMSLLMGDTLPFYNILRLLPADL